MSKKELVILKTDEDRTGFQIAKMTDFLADYVKESVSKLPVSRKNPKKIVDVSNVAIFSEVISGSMKILNSGTSFVPDFEHLPFGVKEKLRKGIYKIGKSKQVDGNYRPVIIDENGIRVKDITLRQVINSPHLTNEIQSISTQLQLQAIREQLNSIQSFQMYQIERQKDSTVRAPFFNARDLISRAQNADSQQERVTLLSDAITVLTDGFTQTGLELKTLSDTLSKSEGKKQSEIDFFIKNMAEDFQLLSIYTGLKMRIFDYLEKADDRNNTYVMYRNLMVEFAQKQPTQKGMTIFELMHDNCSYSKTNLNCWYIASEKIKNIMKEDYLSLDCKEAYLIGVEDSKK